MAPDLKKINDEIPSNTDFRRMHTWHEFIGPFRLNPESKKLYATKHLDGNIKKHLKK